MSNKTNKITEEKISEKIHIQEPTPDLAISEEEKTKEEDFTLFQGEKPVLNKYRGLIGWMSENEAINFLLGRQPGDKDDLTSIKQKIENYHTAVNNRSTFDIENPVSLLDEIHAKLLSTRPDIQSSFAQLDWSPALVDLQKVLSYQPTIKLDGLESRVENVSNDIESLINFCLPINEPIDKIGALIDGDQKGYTISSLNPNLRVMGSQMQDMKVSPGEGIPEIKLKAVTFLFGMGNSYLNVGLYNNRYFLRDGYHRAYGLLKKGIYKVPCILIKARNTNELGLKPGMFSYETIFSERPPKLADTLDDLVAGEGKRIAMRTVLRFRGEEFAVQR